MPIIIPGNENHGYSAYLPGKESWYKLRNGLSYASGVSHEVEVLEDSIPSFQRAGTIVPGKDRFRRSSTKTVNDPYTLVIVLNSSLAAEGELYVDDGKSYDFEQGAYIHHQFVFSNRKLSSSSRRPTNLANKNFFSDCAIERIVFLGLPAGVKRAVVEPGNFEVDIEPGPLMLC